MLRTIMVAVGVACGALHAAWFALAVTAINVGMRLPLPSSFQVGTTVAIVVIGAIALHWLRG